MLKNEYPEFDGEFEVIHHSELIHELIQSGQLELPDSNGKEIVIHDSCYLGRYNNLYNAPRAVLKAACSSQVIEMPRSRNKSFCCGAGGARMFMEETEGKRINHLRVAEAEATGAKTVATSCPFCLTMFNDGIKETGIDDQLQVMDIAQIVADKIP